MSTSQFARWSRKTSALARFVIAVAAFCAATAATGAAERKNPDNAATIGAATTLRAGEFVTGSLPNSAPIHVEVSLKLRNRDVLQHVIDALTKPSLLPAQRGLMSDEEYFANHAPTEEQVQRVIKFLTDAGFQNIAVAPNRLLIGADGSAGVAQQAFLTSFARVRARDNSDAYANTEAVHVPAALQDTVLGVLGLQNVHHPHTVNVNAVKTPPLAGHNPLEFSSIYGGFGEPTAAGITVGIITAGKMDLAISDLQTFTARNGLPTVPTQVVYTGATPVDYTGSFEWSLDSQSLVGMAGGHVGRIIFYAAPDINTNANLTASYNAAVSANIAKIINVSIGDCETTLEQDNMRNATDDQIFALAVAHGQTFSVSSGDSGSDECTENSTAPPNTPAWPASSQYVVAVGGTYLRVNTDGSWLGETVWNDLATQGFATGGSPSTFEPMPTWQQNVGQNVGHSTRGVPDVAFDAEPTTGGQIIYTTPCPPCLGTTTQSYGGTSLAAPIFAGLWARVLAVKGTNIGFAAPLIYRLPAADFHDVTVGNNGGETAATGWDYTTGFGSMILSNVIRDLPVGGTPTANFSYTVTNFTANFTDSSTDSGGTIGTYSWNFGDGGTSTTTSPSHTYASAGTYMVTETVTDAVSGAVSTKNASVSITAAFKLTATPNPVTIPAGSSSATFTLTWSAPGYSQVTLYGQQNSGQIQCLGSGAGSGSTTEGIGVGAVFNLWLLPYTGCTPGSFVGTVPSGVLASTIVTSATMSATPNPVTIPSGKSSANFTLSWNAAGFSQVTLYGQQNISNAGKIQCLGSGAGSGTTTENVVKDEVLTLWLLPNTGCTPGSFVSALPSAVLATVSVKVAATMSAYPSPVVVPAGQTSSSYSLTWDAPGYSQVTLYGQSTTNTSGPIKCLGSGPGSGTTTEGIAAGEIQALWLLPYTGCTPGATVSKVPNGVLTSINVRAHY